MNGLVIVLIGIVALGAGYLLYGRWLQIPLESRLLRE